MRVFLKSEKGINNWRWIICHEYQYRHTNLFLIQNTLKFSFEHDEGYTIFLLLK